MLVSCLLLREYSIADRSVTVMQNINDAYKSGKKIYMMHAEEAEKIFKHLREWRIRQLVEYDIRQTGSLFRAAGMKSYATISPKALAIDYGAWIMSICGDKSFEVHAENTDFHLDAETILPFVSYFENPDLIIDKIEKEITEYLVEALPLGKPYRPEKASELADYINRTLPEDVHEINIKNLPRIFELAATIYHTNSKDEYSIANPDTSTDLDFIELRNIQIYLPIEGEISGIYLLERYLPSEEYEYGLIKLNDYVIFDNNPNKTNEAETLKRNFNLNWKFHARSKYRNLDNPDKELDDSDRMRLLLELIEYIDVGVDGKNSRILHTLRSLKPQIFIKDWNSKHPSIRKDAIFLKSMLMKEKTLLEIEDIRQEVRYMFAELCSLVERVDYYFFDRYPNDIAGKLLTKLYEQLHQWLKSEAIQEINNVSESNSSAIKNLGRTHYFTIPYDAWVIEKNEDGSCNYISIPCSALNKVPEPVFDSDEKEHPDHIITPRFIENKNFSARNQDNGKYEFKSFEEVTSFLLAYIMKLELLLHLQWAQLFKDTYAIQSYSITPEQQAYFFEACRDSAYVGHDTISDIIRSHAEAIKKFLNIEEDDDFEQTESNAIILLKRIPEYNKRLQENSLPLTVLLVVLQICRNSKDVIASKKKNGARIIANLLGRNSKLNSMDYYFVYSFVEQQFYANIGRTDSYAAVTKIRYELENFFANHIQEPHFLSITTHVAQRIQCMMDKILDEEGISPPFIHG